MAEVLAVADIVQQYKGNIILYKGDVAYVNNVGNDPPHSVSLTMLLDGSRKVVKFNLDDFTPPNSRLGMVNTRGSVIYLTRKPVRRMNVGINFQNIQGDYLPCPYPEGQREALADVATLKSPDLARTMLGVFPTFEECIMHAKDFAGCMAFDRQFAIDCNRKVYYKTQSVGSLPRNCTRPERISFNRGYEHLEILIGDNCAQTLQPVGS